MRFISRRIALLLPANLGLVAMGKSSAQAQDSLVGDVDQFIKQFRIQDSNEFSIFFNMLWDIRIITSKATAQNGAPEDIQLILSEATNKLNKDYDGKLNDNLEIQVKNNTVYFQNAVIGMGTDMNTGIVNISKEMTAKILNQQNNRANCIYPFCLG